MHVVGRDPFSVRCSRFPCGAQTRDAVRHAIRNAEDLRRRIRDLTKEAIIERKVSLDDLSSLTGDTIQGAAEALNDTLPASRRRCKVIDGLADAYAGMAEATRAGLDEASHRGARLSKAEADCVRRCRRWSKLLMRRWARRCG